MDGRFNCVLQLATCASRPVLTEPSSLKQSPNHGLYERIKLAARVEDKVWYLSHRIMAAVSAAFCFGVVIVGGVMTSISNPNPFQYCAAFLPVSINPFVLSERSTGLDASQSC